LDKSRTISVVDYLFEGELQNNSSRNPFGLHQRFGKMKECVRDAPAALAENGGQASLNLTRHKLLNKLGICKILKFLNCIETSSD
jgi:hypothetical protein